MLEVAVSVAVMTFAPEAITLVCAHFLGATAATALMSTTLGSAMQYGISGALANASSQLVGVAIDHQKFDFKAVASNGLMSAISGGMGAKFNSTNLVNQVLNAEATAVIQQVVLKLSGLERHYDWKTVETAGFNAGSGYVVGADHKNISSAVIAAGASSFADQINSSLMYTHKVDWSNVSAVSVGSMAGTYGGKRLDEMLKAQTEGMRRAERAVDQMDYDVAHTPSEKTSSQYLSELSSRQR